MSQTNGSTTSSEIANLVAEKENELKTALQSKEVVDQEEISLARQILELRLRKKDVELAISKAQYNVRQLEIEKRQLEKQFWSAKNSGI
jgi:hypothetical protein